MTRQPDLHRPQDMVTDSDGGLGQTVRHSGAAPAGPGAADAACAQVGALTDGWAGWLTDGWGLWSHRAKAR